MSAESSPGAGPDVRTALERLIAGELRAEEAAQMAAAAGYRSFADLCEAELPGALPRVRLDRTRVREQIGAALSGRSTLADLRAWAEELAAVLDRHELGVSVVERRRVGEALALVAVAADARIFKNTGPVVNVLSAIARALDRPRAASLSALYGTLFHGQPELHLLPRRLEDAQANADDEPPPAEEAGPKGYLPQGPSFADELGLGSLDLDSGLDDRWGDGERARPDAAVDGPRCADVVALHRPFQPGSRVQDYEWVVAFSVATRSLVQEDTVPGAQAPQFLERARELAPNFDLTRFKPEARRDQDGVLELVLDATTIGRAELLYAAKLFALVHQVGHVTFEGERLPTIGPSSSSSRLPGPPAEPPSAEPPAGPGV